MTWENAINIKLNLEDRTRKIISDKTGILFSEEFRTFLSDQKIPHQFTDNLQELHRLSANTDTRIIITSLSKVPAFLSSSAELLSFTLADIPLNADVRALQKLTLSELMEILNFLNTDNLLQPVNQYTISYIQARAKSASLDVAIAGMMKKIDALLSTEPSYNLILELGYQLGALQYKIYLKNDQASWAGLSAYQQRIDQFTEPFILNGNLKNIFYESAGNLKSVDKTVPYIKTVAADDKIALLCFDCMGITEWALLKEYLVDTDLKLKEQSTFALIPSITSISRASIFYGSYNAVFGLASVNEEKGLQNQFPGKSCRIFREKDSITSDSLLGIDVVAVIYNVFDDLSHSAKFPPENNNKSLYLSSAINYLAASSIRHQLEVMLSEGFRLFICSDHGSVVATGNGRKVEKYLQEKFAKRACLIGETPLTELLGLQQMKIPFIEDKILVLPGGRTMFDQLNKVEITHGGITVDEIVVPFAEILR